ncbi:putative mitotic spindle assembly checkpoint protein MAD1 [Blattamonas nauphoetae]|uniref:Mitotic spindle assembly checkpoint protein MAD1 n=1 Tax=Blattamonas nauphoetae TaxID=2049346 RepID=A0ABQ9Y4G3_9EUKA|nr:putative mitotic spindle assembly checkpoint protein MAD1 [Blattamonas nauphoetae]
MSNLKRSPLALLTPATSAHYAIQFDTRFSHTDFIQTKEELRSLNEELRLKDKQLLAEMQKSSKLSQQVLEYKMAASSFEKQIADVVGSGNVVVPKSTMEQFDTKLEGLLDELTTFKDRYNEQCQQNLDIRNALTLCENEMNEQRLQVTQLTSSLAQKEEKLRQLSKENEIIPQLQTQISNLNKDLLLEKEKNEQIDQNVRTNEIIMKLQKENDILKKRSRTVELLEERVNLLEETKNERNERLSELETIAADKNKLSKQLSEWSVVQTACQCTYPADVVRSFETLQREKIILQKQADSFQQQLMDAERNVVVLTSKERESSIRTDTSERALAALRKEMIDKEVALRIAHRTQQIYRDILDASNSITPATSVQTAFTRMNELEAELRRTTDSLNAALAEKDRLITHLQSERHTMDQKEQDLKLQLEQAQSAKENDSRSSKVLHMILNPQEKTKDIKHAQEIAQLQSELDAARAQITALLNEKGLDQTTLARLVSNPASETHEVETLKRTNSELQTQIQRLKSAYAAKTREFMDACRELVGYNLEMIGEGEFRVSSVYAETSEDYLLFSRSVDGLHLLNTPFAETLRDQIEAYLEKCNSIPAFLSDLTLHSFGNQTYIPPSTMQFSAFA